MERDGLLNRVRWWKRRRKIKLVETRGKGKSEIERGRGKSEKEPYSIKMLERFFIFVKFVK